MNCFEGLFFIYFRIFMQTLQYLNQIYVKISIQYWDSKPQPSELESPPVTTRPGLPPSCPVILNLIIFERHILSILTHFFLRLFCFLEILCYFCTKVLWRVFLQKEFHIFLARVVERENVVGKHFYTLSPIPTPYLRPFLCTPNHYS